VLRSVTSTMRCTRPCTSGSTAPLTSLGARPRGVRLPVAAVCACVRVSRTHMHTHTHAHTHAHTHTCMPTWARGCVASARTTAPSLLPTTARTPPPNTPPPPAANTRPPTRPDSAQTQICQGLFQDLHAAGNITEQSMEQLYSEAAGKFLADRFVAGTCPKCGYEVRRARACVCVGGGGAPGGTLLQTRHAQAGVPTRASSASFLRCPIFTTPPTRR
jgi:hypothetical protein